MNILGDLHDRKEIGMGDPERILRVCDSITEYLYSRYGGYTYESTGEEMKRMIKTFIDPRVKREGIEEGKREGVREGKIEVAKSLLLLGERHGQNCSSYGIIGGRSDEGGGQMKKTAICGMQRETGLAPKEGGTRFFVCMFRKQAQRITERMVQHDPDNC